MFKKYQWYNPKMQKRYGYYTWGVYGMMALVLICLFFFPQSLKMLNILFIVIGVVFWYLAYSTQMKDKKIKEYAKAKNVQNEKSQ